MRKSLLILSAVLLLALPLAGCRGVESCPAEPDILTQANNWEGDAPQDVIDVIEAAGHRISRISTEPSILHGQRYHMELDDDKQHAVTVYKYESAEAAAAEAACIGADGFSFTFPLPDGKVSCVQVDWVDLPHFYRSGSTIILYIGQDAGLLTAFENAFGAPFAGTETAAACGTE